MINFYLAQRTCQYPGTPYPKLTTLAKIDLEGQVNRQDQEIEELRRTINAFQAQEANLQRREANQTELERSINIPNRRWSKRKESCLTNVQGAHTRIETLTRERDELKEKVKKQDRRLEQIMQGLFHRYGIIISFCN